MPTTPYRVKFPKGLDINDAKPYAFALYLKGEEQGPHTTPFHRHPNGLIGFSATDGRFSMDLADRTLPVPRHVAVYVPPGVLHNSHLTKGSVMLSFHIAPEVCERFLPDKPMRIVLNRMTEEMLKHFASVYKNTDACITARRLVSLIVQEVRMAPRVPESFGLLPENAVLRQIAMALSDAQEPLKTIEEWGEQFGMSGKTLSRLVVRETGMTFGKWSTHFRLLAALEALNDNQTIEAAAGAARYATTSAFIESFSKVFGCTPGTYRNQDLLEGNLPFFDIPARNS